MTSDQSDERTRRELATTRKLYLIWAALIASVAIVFCYLVFTMIRAREPLPVKIGRTDDFPQGAVTLKYVNANYEDPSTEKNFGTLSLQIVRDEGDNFTVFFARSTDPVYGSLTPRQCVLAWDRSLQLFVDPCGGSKWSRAGKYSDGAAPRDLDRFPASVVNGNLVIQLDLILGAAHP